MIALIQRVSEARVRVAGRTVGEIGPGVLALIGVERADAEPQAARLLERVLGYRIFPDGAGRMNRSLADTGGALLLVPQFTLAADTRQGHAAGFSTAAERNGRALSGLCCAWRRRRTRTWPAGNSRPRCRSH
jgi:D-tyrosyl-tRNA(Tyr) deacylase